MTIELSRHQARRLALSAQGLAERRPSGRVDIRHLRRVMDRIGVLQIDSVNVLVRSHYLPLFSRLGPYAPTLLDDAAYLRRELFEYWGHAASYLPMKLYPVFRTRMEAFRNGRRGGSLARFGREHPDYMEAVLAEVERRGPLSAAMLDDPGERSGPWWGWRKGKSALEWLFAVGEVSVSHRVNFERWYDLTDRVIPAAVLAQPVPTTAEARRVLMLAATKGLGVGTARDVADYFRIGVGPARQLLREAVADGELVEARVEGWRQPGFCLADVVLPRKVPKGRLLSPFDSLVWDRDRVERLFGFRYRIEIYVPEQQRQFGYYVLPFLLGTDLVARVDLKADRPGGALLVRSAHLEPGADAVEVARALAEELRAMAIWLDLPRIVVSPTGDLASRLSAALP